MELQYQQRQKTLEKMGRHPFILNRPAMSPSPNAIWQSSQMMQTSNSNHSARNFLPKSRPLSPQKQVLFMSRTLLPFQASVLNENRTVHYKKGQVKDNRLYTVEISSNKETLFITAFNLEKTQTLLMQIHGHQADQVMDLFGFNFDWVAYSLQVTDNGTALALLEPQPFDREETLERS
jgi:hypothetical protein